MPECPRFPLLHGEVFDERSLREVQQYYAELDKYNVSIGNDEAVVGANVGRGDLLRLSKFAKKRVEGHAAMRESLMPGSDVRAEPKGFDSGFCYLSLIKPLWVRAAADHLGFAPELGVLLSSPKAWFDCNVLCDKRISVHAGGRLHVGADGSLEAFGALQSVAIQARHWPRGSLAALLRASGLPPEKGVTLRLHDRLGYVEDHVMERRPLGIMEFSQPPGFCYRDLLAAGSTLGDRLGAFPTLKAVVSSPNCEFSFRGLMQCNLIPVRDNGLHVYPSSANGNFLPRVAGAMSGWLPPEGSLGEWLEQRAAERFVVSESAAVTLDQVCGAVPGSVVGWRCGCQDREFPVRGGCGSCRRAGVIPEQFRAGSGLVMASSAVGGGGGVPSSNCVLLGRGYMASGLCEVCSIPPRTIPWSHSEHLIDKRHCEGVDAFREVREGKSAVCVVRGAAGRSSAARRASCVVVQDNPILDFDACVSMVFVPRRTEFSVEGCEVSTMDQTVAVIVLGKARVVFSKFPGDQHVGVRVGDSDDKLRWLHKYVGEHTNDTFSRFWRKTGQSVCWIPTPSTGFSPTVFAGPDNPYSGKVPGTTEAVVDRSGVFFTGDHGTTVVSLVGSWLAGGAGAPMCAAIKVGQGVAVTFPRKVFVVDIRPYDAKRKASVLLVRGIDDYALDDGGPSDDEFPDEF